MWARNLVFVLFVLGAAGALSASLFPEPEPKRPAASKVATKTAEQGAGEVVRAVNRAFRTQWEAEKVTPALPAPELAVLRRLELALTGSIPSLEEIRRFEAGPAGRRLAERLDRLFLERRYTDYMAERLARAYVGTEGGPFLLYRRSRFVRWISDALMENRPYDQLVRDLIAGNGLWTDHPSTNFLTVTRSEETETLNPERLAARSARAFLGVRLDCAQCHDHPFQPWKQRDFQGIAAFYGQAVSGFTGVRDGTGKFETTNRKTGKPETIEPRVPFLANLWGHDGPRRAQLARWVTHPENTYFARASVNRVWALLFGRPLVEPVDDLPSASEIPPVLDLLAADFVSHGYDLERLIRTIAATEAFQLDSAASSEISDAQDHAWAVFPMTRLRSEQVAGAVLQSASVETIDQDSHIVVRLIRYFGEQNFVHRYGDAGEDELEEGTGTIPQRLLMMNGDLVEEKTKKSLFNAATRIGMLAPDDRKAVETAYLTVFTRRPSAEEAAHFVAKLSGTQGDERTARMTDLFWTLVNSTEFSWNH